MTFQNAVRTCLQQKYTSFSGRAARSEYWWFALASFLFTLSGIVVFFVVNFLSGGFSKTSGLSSLGLIVLFLGLIGYLALILPGIAVSVRRLHDVNLSGWWLLAACIAGAIPFVGWIASLAIFVLSLIKGTTGENKFGPDPVT